jgi:hypothetical protein
MIPNGVLAPKVAGDLLADANNLGRRLREICLPPRHLSQALEHRPRMSPGVHIIKNPQGVNLGIRCLRAFQELVEAQPAGIVFSIANEDQRLAVRRPLLHVLQSLGEPIIKGGIARGRGSRDGPQELLGVASKRNPFGQPHENSLVEINHKHLILGIAGPRKRHGGGGNLRTLAAHTPAIVDDQSHRHRHIFRLKERDLLRTAILKYLEIVRPQARYRLPPAVGDDDRQNDQSHINGNPVFASAWLTEGTERLRGYGTYKQQDGCKRSNSWKVART